MTRRMGSIAPWRLRIAALLVLGLWATTGSATAVPDGFGDAKLRMSVDQVRKVYPKLALAPMVQGKEFLSHPRMQRYLLTNVTVMNLRHPVEVEFRFWNGQLWTVIVYYNGNTQADVTSALTRTYGPPNSPVGDPSWVTQTSKLVTSPQAQWYSINDKALGREAQEAFVASLDRHGPPLTVPPTPAPAAPK